MIFSSPLVDCLDDGVVVALVDGLADLLVCLGDRVVDVVEVQVVDDGMAGQYVHQDYVHYKQIR